MDRLFRLQPHAVEAQHDGQDHDCNRPATQRRARAGQWQQHRGSQKTHHAANHGLHGDMGTQETRVIAITTVIAGGTSTNNGIGTRPRPNSNRMPP